MCNFGIILQKYNFIGFEIWLFRIFVSVCRGALAPAVFKNLCQNQQEILKKPKHCYKKP